MSYGLTFTSFVLLNVGPCGWGYVHLQQPIEIPMRDVRPDPYGQTHLAADLYLPASEGSWPVILIQTPYGKERFEESFLSHDETDPLLKSPDYAFVVMDWRGFGENQDDAYENAPSGGQDGHDAVKWIGEQPWCTQRVGTWGSSALGNIQMRTAAEQPPYLEACVPRVYHYREWYDQVYPGGVYARNRNQFVYTLFGGIELVRAVPLYQPWWPGIESNSGDPTRIEVPMLHISGWYDHETIQTIREMQAVQADGGEGARGRQTLLIGPWSHSHIDEIEQGELSYPAAEYASSLAALEFFDFYLRDIPNGWESRAAIRYFRMNDDRWRESRTWPPPSNEQTLYLIQDGTLQADPPTSPEASLSYVSDPTDPVPTTFGPLLWPFEHLQGPGDLSRIESRSDVLTFTTPPRVEPLEIEGNPRVRLWFECDAMDTDLAVRLSQVYPDPDGRSMLLTNGIRRGSLRNGYSEREWLSADGGPYAIDVDLAPIAVTVPAGHRLRISVAPSNYPLYDKNMQDGSSISDEDGAVAVTATVRILLDADHPSHLVLPVAPEPVAADFDQDGDVDANDGAVFESCATGPAIGPPSPGCERADWDGDGDVDQADYGPLQQSFTGPGAPEV